jgi:hypothetical protein
MNSREIFLRCQCFLQEIKINLNKIAIIVNIGICKHSQRRSLSKVLPHDHLLLDSAPNIGPLISRWELDKFKICWNKSFRTSIILTILYQQFLNLLISRRDMSGPRLGALSNNRWSGGTTLYVTCVEVAAQCPLHVYTLYVVSCSRFIGADNITKLLQ